LRAAPGRCGLRASAHGRHKPMMRFFRAGLTGGLFHPGDGSDCFHDLAGLALAAMARLAVEMHQVGEDGLGAELTQHGGDLPAMVGAVIHHVLHRLPTADCCTRRISGFCIRVCGRDRIASGCERKLKGAARIRPSARRECWRRDIAWRQGVPLENGPGSARARSILRRRCGRACRARTESWSHRLGELFRS